MVDLGLEAAAVAGGDDRVVVAGRHLVRPQLERLFFFNETATTEIYTLSLHDALPIWTRLTDVHLHDDTQVVAGADDRGEQADDRERSEEHTSELQSRRDLVCRLL